MLILLDLAEAATSWHNHPLRLHRSTTQCIQSPCQPCHLMYYYNHLRSEGAKRFHRQDKDTDLTSTLIGII